MAVAVAAIAQPRVRILEDNTAVRLSIGANKRHQWEGCFPYINMDSISVESGPRKFSVITNNFCLNVTPRSLGNNASGLLPLLFDVIPGIIFLFRKYCIFIQKKGHFSIKYAAISPFYQVCF